MCPAGSFLEDTHPLQEHGFPAICHRRHQTVAQESILNRGGGDSFHHEAHPRDARDSIEGGRGVVEISIHTDHVHHTKVLQPLDQVLGQAVHVGGCLGHGLF